MADEADSKSVDGNIVRVQVPLPALSNQEQRINRRRSVYFFAHDASDNARVLLQAIFCEPSETRHIP